MPGDLGGAKRCTPDHLRNTWPATRCSTAAQDLTAQLDVLTRLGVDPQWIYAGHGLTGTSHDRPGLREALAAVQILSPSSPPSPREGDRRWSPSGTWAPRPTSPRRCRPRC